MPRLYKKLLSCIKKRMWLQVIGFYFLFFTSPAGAQTPENPGRVIEQQMENATENNEDIVPEDDSYLQLLQHFTEHPMDINNAEEADLQELHILTPMQIQQFFSYRRIFGNFISIYELQALPLWDIGTLEKIRPFLSVSNEKELLATIKTRLAAGERQLLLRTDRVLERAKGYLPVDSTVKNFYPGSPQRVLIRYTYSYKNLLQYGILGEKDAGEQFLRGGQKQGFDFYSAHFFARDLGLIKAIAIGDYTVNLGQGLVQWQNLAFRKSSAVMNIKREGDILKPYHSAGEINFHRGFGISLAKKNWAATGFVSYRKIDANVVTDSARQQEMVSSFQSSGYHRTASEIADKGSERQLEFGGNISYRFKMLHLGLNAVSYRFKLPLVKSPEPYNKYAANGSKFSNYSIDHSFTLRNMHVFGEFALDNNFNKALIEGLLVSVSANTDLSLVYRNISPAYQSFYSSAFTVNSAPNNENGLYIGVSIRPEPSWQFDLYADHYQFPWLKYRVNGPSAGRDFLVQGTYKYGKKLEIIGRYRFENKTINYNSGQLVSAAVVSQSRQNLRTQVNYQVKKELIFRGRAEMVWFDRNGPSAEQGFLAFTELLYKPGLKAYSGNAGLSYFETEGYNSRIYAYQNDVLYGFSIPVLYGKGFNYYINLQYRVNKKIRVWARWSQTFYSGTNHIGSGLDEISGNHKTEFKLQAICKI